MRNSENKRAYIVQYGREYFAGWKSTDWTTVPRIATWTKDRNKAAQIYIDSVIDRQDIINLVVGFSNTHLLELNMEDYKQLTPRKPKIWKSHKY